MMQGWIAFLTCLFCLCFSIPLYSAACCSGGSAVPSMITGDDRYQLRMVIDGSFTVGNVDAHGRSLFFDDPLGITSVGIIPSAAYRIGELWQVGLKLPIRSTQAFEQTATGLGDLKVNAAYEPFPLYTYSAWRPKLFLFAAVSFPTGTSSYETTNPTLHSKGRGFFGPSLGFVALRTWRAVDVAVLGEWIYQLERSFESERVQPGPIFSTTCAAGYSLSDFRLGASLGVTYEMAGHLRRSGQSTPEKLIWDTQVELAYTLNERFGVALSYLDQSLIGPAKNVDLTRSLSFSLTYRKPV